MIYQSEKTTSVMRALSKFRAKGVTVYAEATRAITKTDTIQYADRNALIQAIQEPLIECKLEVTYSTEYHEGQEFAVVTITHTTSGQFIKSYQKLFNVEVEKKSTKYSEYLDYQGAVENIQKQKTYFFRTMTLDILMISVIEKGEELKAPQDLSKKVEAKAEPQEPTAQESDTQAEPTEPKAEPRDIRARAILELYIRTANHTNKTKAKKYAEIVGGREWKDGYVKHLEKVEKLEKVLVKKGLICDIKKPSKGGKDDNSK
jgi:hypothetical protein